ncbi:MAG TPA: hypothetical protein VJ739_13270, partial [Gemmataceae bacterium]|nr:hypothetical protein [Gemmataceae bacterium]
MATSPDRRQFLNRTLTAGALAGLADFGFLRGLPPVSADEAKLPSSVCRFTPEIEPLVRLIEDTPREKLMEVAAAAVGAGTSYQQLLAAVLLAGVRGIKPRPVGFKFHAVLVINSAHLAAQAAPDRDRWLPLFWALDNFKSSQAKNKEESGGWMMSAVDEAKLPPATQARARFTEAMDNWDEEGADRAVTALVRSAGAEEVIETFWRYGARDFRDIGHKAIYVANSWRAMQTVGWRHAEPVMRSLAFALLEHEGDNPAKRDDMRDRPGRENLERVWKVRRDWQQGKPSARAGQELVGVLRTAGPGEACDWVVAELNKGVAPASLWDGLFLRAGELLMQQPGIIGVHCVTSINALHYGYTASGDDATRRFLLLQAAAFLPLFRGFMDGRGKVRTDLHLDALEKEDVKAKGPEAVEEILAEVSKDKLSAARKTLAWLAAEDGQAGALMTAARRLIFNKGTDAHDYKF